MTYRKKQDFFHLLDYYSYLFHNIISHVRTIYLILHSSSCTVYLPTSFPSLFKLCLGPKSRIHKCVVMKQIQSIEMLLLGPQGLKMFHFVSCQCLQTGRCNIPFPRYMFFWKLGRFGYRASIRGWIAVNKNSPIRHNPQFSYSCLSLRSRVC